MIDPRTPVVVGVGTAGGRPAGSMSNPEAVELMAAAARAAAADAGDPDLLRRAGMVVVPRGTWRYHDPAGLVAERIGAADAVRVVGELGILQTTLVAHAATAIVTGAADVALVVGAEARWRDIQAAKAGTTAPVTDDPSAVPDDVLSPDHPIITKAELAVGLNDAPRQYALLDNATRHAAGHSVEEGRRVTAELWARFSEVAQHYSEAWNRQPFSVADLEGEGAGRMLAVPYRKWHVSQWNVDQAGAVLLASVGAARQFGLAEDGWAFPHAITWSDHMIPVSQRAILAESPGFAVAGAEAFRLAGVGVDDVAYADLYSCFPIAVRHQAAAIGLGLDRTLTLTGGMTFGGGPFNNYVLQSLPAMIRTLRSGSPNAVGLVSAVSGIVTKQGVSLWGLRPPDGGYRTAEVGAAVAEVAPTLPMVDADGAPGRIATYTVVPGANGDLDTVVVVADVQGGRAVATNGDPDVVASAAADEWCGRDVVVTGTAWVPAA